MSKKYKIPEDQGMQIFEEAMMEYVTSYPALVTTKGKVNYGDFFKNKMLIISTIRRGVSYKVFEAIRNLTPFTEEDWASYLGLSTKTLQRNSKQVDFLFKPIQTEKIIELAEVTNFGLEVFDDQEQFYSWLSTPSRALGDMKPSELLRDSYGKELVMAELNRIEYGIFA